MRIYEPFNFPDELATNEHPKPESGEALYWYETALQFGKSLGTCWNELHRLQNAMTISNAVLAEALRTAINVDNVFEDADTDNKD